MRRGRAAWVSGELWHYPATWPETALLDPVIANVAPEARWSPAPADGVFVLGGSSLLVAGLAAWGIAAP